MTDKLEISNDLLIRLAGKPAFNRSMDYFRGRHVLGLRHKGNMVNADVEGNENYRAKRNFIKWLNDAF